MSTYIIAIGGTGSKIAESIVHAAAMGIFINESNLEDLHILFVDPDTGNGNFQAANTAIQNYQKCTKAIGYDQSIHWMQTKIKEIKPGLLSPLDKDTTLKDIFKFKSDNNHKNIKHLFDVLYTKEEQVVDLKEGFRGRPSVGAAVMAQLSQYGTNQDSWTTFLDQIEAEHNANKSPKVFICGSIFGGTGASGFPTLGQMIAHDLGEEGRNILNNVKLGGLLMLPYFQFTSPTQKSNEKQIFSRSEEFLIKTEAALRYYREKDLRINSIYLLGVPNLASGGVFSTGGTSQRNPQHYLEFYGALAIRDFIFKKHPKEEQKVVLLSRQESGAVNWDDIPDKEDVRKKLINTTRFAFAWLSVIVPDIDEIKKLKKQRAAIWSLKFFNSIQEIEDDADNLNVITAWCKDYLQWIGYLHISSSNEMKLLNTHAFLDTDGQLKLDRKEFPNLVHNIQGVKIIPILEKLSSNYNSINPPRDKFVGLAKTLYFTIAQN
ncbi:tubulin-like doman-containing protein [Trichormus variabilis]|uniref:Uncharacterized protein n=1 Tax=Trichormus variabilis SAG 1403-4b TaxID=447716 RepID=A0A3S1ADQ9_ANAVA|nr:tubulin-like doman-containing protein [Trichormus variabilis]MBD2625586.1 hypothetical protein [Trichormus variabilis FACHB-164]RUS98868.1 hypothetical protein DSM107003_08870 [Trichormus variabilis SAG 1403-4b]